MLKTPVMCCVLGKCDPFYSCLFCASSEAVELDYPFVKYLFWFLILQNSNNEIYQNLHMSFLNYLLIIKAKRGDLCTVIIIIIISFSISFTFRTMPNDWKKMIRMTHSCEIQPKQTEEKCQVAVICHCLLKQNKTDSKDVRVKLLLYN